MSTRESRQHGWGGPVDLPRELLVRIDGVPVTTAGPGDWLHEVMVNGQAGE